MTLSISLRGTLAGVVAAAMAAACLLALPAAHAAAAAAPQLHVTGDRLVDQNGSQVVLRGVDRSGAEYACVRGNGIFDGPNDQASINAIKSWGSVVNAVRVPLNEACWNAESYVNSAYAGSAYINAIKAYVNLLNSNGLVAILDLHWTDGTYTGSGAGCSSAQAVCQKPMPDAAQAIPFWTSVAGTLKGNNAVVFDLFNEPYNSQTDGNSANVWNCWKTGSPCNGISYPVAGMQQMVNAVRSTGATNVLMLGGEQWSNDLTGWLQYKPTDPDNNLAVSWHSYSFNACSNQSCWNSQIAPVIAQVPLIAGEIGETDCTGNYINPLTTWLDSQQSSYIAWAWNADFGCGAGPGLITDYAGTPTNFGAAYKAHLLALSGSGGGGGGGSGGGSTGAVHAVGAGKCLDVPGASTAAGTQVQIWDCNGQTNQTWTHTSSNQLTVYGGGSQLCLDAFNNQTAPGTKVQTWTCTGGANQQWSVNSNGTITGVQSGLCLDVTGANTADGALVELWTCNGGSNQHWTLG
jgi:endoglucanase